jgi:hypothetical protein
MDADRLQRHHIKTLRADFIASIDRDDICSLASLHNHNRPCHIAGKPLSGSFNVCFPVEFSTGDKGIGDTQKWVARFPLPSVHDVKEKLRSEVATMKFDSSLCFGDL